MVDISFMTFEIHTISLESKSDLVIGIDFGTTFTGVAFAHSGQIQGNDTAKIAESVTVVSWPGATLSNTDKIPTVISYNRSPPSWGGNVRDRDDMQVAHFKLGLQPDAARHYGRLPFDTGVSALSFLEPGYRHPKLPGKTALDFTADYLKAILTYIRDDFFPRKFGATFLRNQQISYVITVPAIWKDSAKSQTRQAAVRAGIPANKLTLITEPEAAALYCATIGQEVDLRDGDRFLICDAGGGTVVCALLRPL
jgi:molecular chaperone DnaK (HSP70)